MKLQKILISAMAASLFMMSCSGDESDTTATKKTAKQVEDADTTTSDSTSIAEKQEFDNLFANVPSPFMMAKQIQSAGTDADVSLLSDYEKASRYTTERKQALNLGLYTADLTYSHVMEARAEEFKYLSAVAFLSQKLGIEKALNLEERLQAFEEKAEDREATMLIINDTYADLESYLKEERREEIAAYMMSGGIVEMLYLASHMGENNADLVQMISDQSTGVSSVIEIIKRLGEPEDDEVIKDLRAIDAIFSQMTESGEKTENSVDEEGGVTLGAVPTKTLNSEQLAELKELVTNIRSRYTE